MTKKPMERLELSTSWIATRCSNPLNHGGAISPEGLEPSTDRLGGGGAILLRYGEGGEGEIRTRNAQRGRSCFQDRSPRQWEPLQQMSGAGIEPAASASSARRCYQLSYPGQTGRLKHGPDWTRTSNLAVKSRLHCQFVLQTQSAAERNRTSTPQGALRFECSASACSATAARKRAMGLEPMTLAR